MRKRVETRKAILKCVQKYGVVSLTPEKKQEIMNDCGEDWDYCYFHLNWLKKNNFIKKIIGLEGICYVMADLDTLQKKMMENV